MVVVSATIGRLIARDPAIAVTIASTAASIEPAIKPDRAAPIDASAS